MLNLSPRLISRTFDVAAATYDAAAALPRVVESRLLEKLDYVQMEPALIVDVGAGTGSASAKLVARFPDARLKLVDLSGEMLGLARRRLTGYGERCEVIKANASALPLADRSADLIFSNLMLPWCAELPAVLDEFRRVLKPGGLLLFSTLGPDTLYELQASWAQANRGVHVTTFVDMHIIGDEMLRAGFADPVMDVERLTATYRDVYQLMRELKAIGAKNINPDRRHTLTGKRRMKRMVDIYQDNFEQDGRIWASYEVLYGHALGPTDGQPRRTEEGMVAEFSVDQLRGSRRSRE